MFSFYIFKNKAIEPNVLLVAIIDNCNNHNLDLIIDEIINSLLANNFINLKNNIIFCIIDRETEIKNFFLNQGSEAKQFDLNKITTSFLEKYTLNTISNLNTKYILNFDIKESKIILKNSEENINFLLIYRQNFPLLCTINSCINKFRLITWITQL